MSDGPRSVRDPGLEAFAEAIESTMRVRRGVDHVLSPREFALVRTWYDAGVSLATILVAIDLAFDVDPSVCSLSFCRRRVEQLAAGATRGAGPTGHETGRPSLPELTERLDALRARLQQLPARAAALPLQEVEEVGDLVAVASRPNWDYLSERLARIDELVSVAALEALERDELQSVRAEAERAAERHRDRVEARPLEEALARLMRQRARERLQLPRVAVF
ncbi:MAG: hypothetical protein LJF15_15025, partial [Acidobacteria bacterium]|nr:hypothetical protein [Acidobacteriota bacterium]